MVIFGALAVSLMAAVLVLGYRARKLEILEPRQLDAAMVWSGQPGAPCTLLMIGDSHVARWQTQPPSGWRVARRGFAGESAVNIAATAPAAIEASTPNVLLIAVGTNDASAAALQRTGRGAALDRAVEAVERIVAAAQAAGVERTLVMSLVPPRFPELWRRLIYGKRQAEMLTALSERIAARARARGAEVLDAAALARDSAGRVRSKLHADALHWSPAGYRILDAALWARLGPKCR